MDRKGSTVADDFLAYVIRGTGLRRCQVRRARFFAVRGNKQVIWCIRLTGRGVGTVACLWCGSAPAVEQILIVPQPFAGTKTAYLQPEKMMND